MKIGVIQLSQQFQMCFFFFIELFSLIEFYILMKINISFHKNDTVFGLFF